jgi:uncharacterized membrane protein YbhN (UPF0104 family)
VSSAPEPTTDHGLDLGGAVKRAAFFVVVLAIAVALILTLPGVGEIRDRLANATHGWIALAALCSILSMLGFVRALWSAFDRVMAWRRALVLGFAEQGANVLLPAGGAGGPALGAVVMTRLGVPSELAAGRHAALFLITSAVSFVAMVVFGTLTSIGVLSNGGAPLLLTLLPAVGAAIAIALALVFALGDTPPEPHGGKLRTMFGRAHRFVHSGARTSVELLRHGDPLLIFGATTYFAFDVAALACAFEAFGGGGPPIGAFVLAYTLGHAGAFLPTPGGVGGVEGGLIGMFVAFGAPIGLAATAVLAYRVFQLGMPAILGAISLLRIRHVLAHPPPREEVAARFAGHS